MKKSVKLMHVPFLYTSKSKFFCLVDVTINDSRAGCLLGSQQTLILFKFCISICSIVDSD